MLPFFLLLVLLSGCSQFSTIRLDIPPVIFQEEYRKQVFLRSITDTRVFLESTSNSDVPSWSSEVTGSEKEGLMKRTVARLDPLGNGSSKEGNLYLAEGQTVESVIRDALVSAFARAGYEVVDQRDHLRPDALVVDVSINKFWGWYVHHPFWNVFTAEIEIALSSEHDGSKKMKVITITTKNTGTFKAANWEIAFQKALREFIQLTTNEYASSTGEKHSLMEPAGAFSADKEVPIPVSLK
jgi:hypothetical protein